MRQERQGEIQSSMKTDKQSERERERAETCGRIMMLMNTHLSFDVEHLPSADLHDREEEEKADERRAHQSAVSSHRLSQLCRAQNLVTKGEMNKVPPWYKRVGCRSALFILW